MSESRGPLVIADIGDRYLGLRRVAPVRAQASRLKRAAPAA
jgi:hypothetical protein